MCHDNFAFYDVIYISNPRTNKLLLKRLLWFVFIIAT